MAHETSTCGHIYITTHTQKKRKVITEIPNRMLALGEKKRLILDIKSIEIIQPEAEKKGAENKCFDCFDAQPGTEHLYHSLQRG